MRQTDENNPQCPDSMPRERQGQWERRLEEEIAEVKQTWLRQLDERQKQWQARLARLNEEIGDAFRLLKVRDDAMTALVWPPFFLDGGALAGWKKKIEDRLAQHDPVAFDLFLALGRFSSAAREAGDRRRLAEALHGVGVEAHRFWKSMGVAELDAALDWRSGFQAHLDASNIPLDIILALERDRFDTNTMLAVDAGTVTRMYVKEALSWTVRDKSSETPIVLCHARVITC
jgi:hypothetical protein